MKVIYPGSFDPVTKGHIDIIKRAQKIFGEVIVAVLVNSNKNGLFTIEERIELLNDSLKDIENIEVDTFSGLLINYTESKGCNRIIRGLRAISDYEVELQMALANRSLNGNVETVFLASSPEFNFLSSSIVKEIASFGGDVSDLVSSSVNEALKEKYKNIK